MSGNIFIGMGLVEQFGGTWEAYKLFWGSRICKSMSGRSLGLVST